MLSSFEEFNAVKAILHRHMRLFAYQSLAMPMIEDANVFLTRAGDKIIDHLFTFERFGRQLALRPEFTATAAHYYVKQGLKTPVRWQFSGAIFEDATDNLSFNYEKQSIGAEFIGQAGIEAEAEVIAMAVKGIEALNIPNWQVVIGHVGLQLHLLSRYQLDSRTYRLLLAQRDRLRNPAEGINAAIDRIREILSLDTLDAELSQTMQGNELQTQKMLDVLLDSTQYGTTMGGRSRHDIAQRLLEKHQRTLEREQIMAALDFLSEWMNLYADVDSAVEQIQRLIGDDEIGQRLFAEWQATLTLLEAYGIPRERITIQADLTKNWEYYTGLVFGIKLANDDYIVGGGRYDELLKILGAKQAVPAVGFAYYVDKLMKALPKAPAKENLAEVTCAFQNIESSVALAFLNELREQGIPISVQFEKAAAVNLLCSSEGILFNQMRYETTGALIEALKAWQL